MKTFGKNTVELISKKNATQKPKMSKLGLYLKYNAPTGKIYDMEAILR